MKILTLNCQRGFQPGLKDFLRKTLQAGEYDFILLQEYAKEVPGYVRGVGSYAVLEAHHTEAGEARPHTNSISVGASQLAIVYRQGFTLLEHTFCSFTQLYFAFLCARIRTPEGVFVVGSLHVRSGLHLAGRMEDIRGAKECLAGFVHSGEQIIFGGDCNFGYPGERAWACHLMWPEYVCATLGLPPTHASWYAEEGPHLANYLAAWLRRVGINVRFSMDHIFVDAATATTHMRKARVLPQRISDHSPVELELC